MRRSSNSTRPAAARSDHCRMTRPKVLVCQSGSPRVVGRVRAGGPAEPRDWACNSRGWLRGRTPRMRTFTSGLRAVLGSGFHRHGSGLVTVPNRKARRARNIAVPQSRLDGRELQRRELRPLLETMAVAREPRVGADRRAASGPARTRLPAAGYRGHRNDRGSPRDPTRVGWCPAVASRLMAALVPRQGSRETSLASTSSPRFGRRSAWAM